MDFLTLCVQQQAFTPGHEADEIRAFWKAAHQKVLFDENWLAAQKNSLRLSAVAEAPPLKQDTSTNDQVLTQPVLAPKVDLGNILAVPTFYGREREMEIVTSWILEDRCQLVSVLGLGGIGKSALAVSLMHQLAEHFEVVIWRSLRDAPPCEAFLDDCLKVLAPEPLGVASTSIERRIDLLIEYMVSQRVLLVIDNMETLLEDKVGAGNMRPGYEGYGKLLRRVADSEHQSCLLLTSREKPRALVSQEGSQRPVRSLRLAGLEISACEQMLGERGLVGTIQETRAINRMVWGQSTGLENRGAYDRRALRERDRSIPRTRRGGFRWSA